MLESLAIMKGEPLPVAGMSGDLMSVRSQLERRIPAQAVLAGVCLALIGSAVLPAAGQTLTYDVGIDVPEFVVLHYWDQIDFEISETEFGQLFIAGYPNVSHGSSLVLASLDGSGLSASAGIEQVVDNVPVWNQRGAVTLQALNGFAVRSVTRRGQVSVEVSLTQKDATGPVAGSLIRAKKVELSAPGTAPKRKIRISSNGNIVWGDIHLQVDLQDATVAGDYDGIRIEIKAESL
jgi:hypothetical protein